MTLCSTPGCSTPAADPRHGHCAACWKLAPRTARVQFFNALRDGWDAAKTLARCRATIAAKRATAKGKAS